MRFRAAPLRQAAIFAAVFVAVRVVYAAVFAGASGTGIRLLDLPLITLPAPFTGVRLLGPVTLDGLAAVALSAVPFAAVIFGFGLLNALFDVRPWFAAAARRGPLRSFARSLVIAWQTLPALAAALRRAARAARLRGERPGPRVLVPVLEDAIERAVTLAASLELRGFAASRRLDGACEVPVRVSGAVLARPGCALSIPSLSLATGTLTVLTGATGAGKSTVLDALSGLFQHADGGVQQGVIEVGGIDRALVPPRDTAGFVGAVAQRVRAAFVGETVAEELGFALALRGVAPVIVGARVAEVAERLGFPHLLSRPISALSAGEAELVAIGAALAERPTLLLVDEPLAELDSAARPRVVAALASLAHEGGMCVLVAEHRVAWFSGVADGWLSIADGKLAELDASSAALRSGHQFSAPSPHWCPPGTNGGGEAPTGASGGEVVSSSKRAGEVVAEARGVSVEHGERPAVDDVSLALAAGEIVALTGPNGAGKSSLLWELAVPRESGRVFVRGDDVRTLTHRDRRSAVALVPESLEDLFVTDSVAAECRRADRRASRGATLRRVGELLGHDATALADTHPRDLSGGQRVCLAVALQLAADPAVLLIDEPVRGLDHDAQREVAAAIRRAAANGTAVMFATHETEFAAAVAQRTIRLEQGRISETQRVTAP
ncbi:ATP-binding cassette domain-containing protein [Gryllotalpicola protaetiae]|uniref:ATP-binding cassette domain-containing protein n=1 Tax=Gryllotalpicola protaetiae TaxID=2419771 RepID=A0A387BUE6_9MICO|nr:ABC transporter ATP-binding protein [Gryllotalpicola protaetiae]AYG04710.1 ATP-binding cassette domain-containing protein [Gryllotalpicola protaetiae]